MNGLQTILMCLMAYINNGCNRIGYAYKVQYKRSSEAVFYGLLGTIYPKSGPFGCNPYLRAYTN